MNKTLLFVVLVTTLFFSCTNINPSHDKQRIGAERNAKNSTHFAAAKQDGILEAQKMEFERTKDIALGYVPKTRLINAMEELKAARSNGSYVQRINALTWAERGSSSDAVGPSNGNGRLGSSVTSGRMRTIWVDLSDGDNSTVWVGGVAGGLWKTTDITVASPSWTLVNDFLGNLAVASICQSPANNNIMYFGTGEKSVNADAVQGGGVWKSTDNGVTWNLLPSTVNFWNVSNVVCDPTDANIIYVSTMGPNLTGIQRSTDGGTTWTNITPTGLNRAVTEMEMSSTGRLHIVCGYAGGYFDGNPSGYRFTDIPSTVAAGTWTSPTVSFTSTAYNVDIATAGNTLYALPANSSYQTNQVWKSTDGGDNWAVTTTTPTTGGSAPVSSGQAWYNLAIGVDPSNPDNVMVGGLNSYRSTDGGATWSLNSVWVTGVPGSSNYIHADHHIIVWNNNQVLDGGDGGIFYSGDDGATFADRNVGLRLKQFYACAIHPTSTNYFLGGTQDNGVHQLNGPGITSSVEVTGGDGAFVHIDEDEPQFQFGSYVYSNFRRSTNGGATWSNINFGNSGLFISPTDYDDVNNRLYGAWSAGRYLRWNDPTTGSSGTSVLVGAFAGGTVSHTSVSKYTPNRVFFGTTNGKIVRVSNAESGSPVALDITGTGMSASTVSCIAQGTTENNLLATFSNYGATHVWVSTVGGGAAGWTNITGTGLPDIPVRWAMFYPDDNTQAILATDMGIYETSLINGGSTVWVQNSSLPAVRTDMLQYRFNDNTFLAATHGRGLWTSTITPSLPYVRFASSYAYSSVKTEATGATTGCRNYTDYTLNMHIDKAPTGAAAVTLSIAGGATATQGIDYDFTTNGNFAAPSNIITFPNGSAAQQTITIRVYNDAQVEGTTPDFFTFNYSIGGGTDAVAAPSSTSYTFYIGDNDVAPTTTTVETVLNNNVTEHLGNNGTYYFYSSAAGRLINSVTGASGSLGCVSSNLYEAGDTWQSFLGGERSQKVIEVTPTTNAGSTYTIGLYFTAAELGGKAPANLRIAKTTAATMAAANSGNTTIVTTSFAAYNGSDYVFTASFTGFSKFFLVDNLVTLPVDLLSFSGSLNTQYHSELQWQTTNQYNLSNFEIQRSYDGSQFSVAGTVNAIQNPAQIQNYSFTDPVLAKTVNFYRLKMVDQDGRSKYSAIIRINNNRPEKFVELVQNPVRETISFIINNQERQNVSVQLISSSGQLVKRWEPGRIEGYVVLPLNSYQIAGGIYVLRVTAGNRTESLRVSIQ